MQIIVEIFALIALILIGFLRGQKKTTPLRKLPYWLPPAFRRPATIFLLVGLLGFSASALVTVFYGIPQPRTADEFSYLLAADTFAHGRLTNPPHPMWKHLETFHEIQQPTYASKYPPAQGLILAFGQVIFGHPIAGVWLSVGLACAAICWMLAGWCPLRWAWFGGLLAVIRLVFSGPSTIFWTNNAYWSQSYWGGAVAALGGALVFGALPRIMKKQRWRDALWLALGLAILANSRPFEGLVVSLPVMVILGVWIVRTNNLSWSGCGRRLVLPMLLVLLPIGGWMGYYNFKVTGNPVLMPYQVHEATYGVAPAFLWQPLKVEPHYNHQLIRDFHIHYEADWYVAQQSLLGWGKFAVRKIADLWMFFIGLILTPFMAALPWIWHRRRIQFALLVWTLLLLALLPETWAQPHYAAPATSLAILLVVETLRQAQLCEWRDRLVGPALVSAVLPILLAAGISSFCLVRYLHPSNWSLDRARILHDLEKGPEPHLVLVHYGPAHSPHEQWIFNRADIDTAKVVWAWEMGPQENRELFDYYQDRRVWLLEADRKPSRLVPYPGSSGTRKKSGGDS